MKRFLLVFIFVFTAPYITIFAKNNVLDRTVLPNKREANEAAALAFPSLAANLTERQTMVKYQHCSGQCAEY